MSKGSVHFYDLLHVENDFRHDVIEGLLQNPRYIPPKYFYDEEGSILFDQITEVQEYYPTRIERALLQKYKHEIVLCLNRDCLLIEPGGGSCSKVRIFIEELKPLAYVPMDISATHLLAAAQQLSKDYDWLDIYATCNDFTTKLILPENLPNSNRVVFFPGSSVGNFTPADAKKFLKKIVDLVGSKGKLLIGVDLKKDKSILEDAYNDSAGVTAAFNMNLLTRINNELSADFDLDGWQHYAFYNDQLGRIEMHLKSLYQQVVHIGDNEFYFDENEKIHTENSYKYSVDEFIQLAKSVGFKSDNVWVDENHLFSIHLFSVNEL